jgi:exodeoxyribonuclease VII small subunit
MTDTMPPPPPISQLRRRLARLETIVSRLESGQAPLEESITLYERARV